MIGNNPITGADAVLLPLRRAKVTFANRSGVVETISIDIPATNNENEAIVSARSVIAALIQTDSENIRIGDKAEDTYPVFVQPIQDASGFVTLE